MNIKVGALLLASTVALPAVVAGQMVEVNSNDILPGVTIEEISARSVLTTTATESLSPEVQQLVDQLTPALLNREKEVTATYTMQTVDYKQAFE